jgi:hypothetical protein
LSLSLPAFEYISACLCFFLLLSVSLTLPAIQSFLAWLWVFLCLPLSLF